MQETKRWRNKRKKEKIRELLNIFYEITSADCNEKNFTLMGFPEFCVDMTEGIYEPG